MANLQQLQRGVNQAWDRVVEANGAKARYRRGVLRIELPKPASRKRRTIPVTAA